MVLETCISIRYRNILFRQPSDINRLHWELFVNWGKIMTSPSILNDFFLINKLTCNSRGGCHGWRELSIPALGYPATAPNIRIRLLLLPDQKGTLQHSRRSGATWASMHLHSQHNLATGIQQQRRKAQANNTDNTVAISQTADDDHIMK